MYIKLHDTFWGDLKRKGVTSEGKLLFSYLLSCPHHNIIGLYYLPLAYVSADLGWGMDTVSKGFAELSEKGFISYDDTAEMVLVRNFLKHNPLDNGNVEKKAAATAAQVPETTLLQELAEIMEGFAKQYPRLYETVSERYANTITITKAITITKDPPAAPVTGACAREEGLGAVVSAYLDRVNPDASQASLEELKGYTRRMGAEVVLRAIDRALDAKKATWNYIRGILRSLEGQGVHCPADWDRLDAEHERNRQGGPPKSGPPPGGGESFVEIAKRLEREGRV